MTRVQQRRIGFAVLSAVLLLAAVATAISTFRGGDDPPKAEAARLAPGDTLVFIDVSTDGDRDAVGRATDLLDRFGLYESQRDALLKRLSGAQKAIDVEKDVEPWLGDEAALALTEGAGATAGSLILIEVTDEDKARDFLRRNPNKPGVREYKDHPIEEYGRVTVSFKDGWLLVGQNLSVQGALDRIRAGGKGSLAESAAYRRATRDLPDGRVATAYASANGLRRLLIPQGDVIGTAAGLLDTPGLEAVGMSVEARDEGARLRVRQALRRGSDGQPQFKPTLVDEVPESALAYLGVRGISGALGNLVRSAAGGSGPVLERLRTELSKQAGGNLQRDVLDLLKGEVAITVERAAPAPLLSIVAKTRDEKRTGDTLQRLQRPLARLLTPRGEAGPKWARTDIGGGVTAHTLALPGGARLAYAVFDDRLVLSTSPDGIRKIREADDSVEDRKAFEAVLDGRPDEVGSLGFLDFSQLLELGEQTGLNDSRAYLAARDDLQKIRAVGVSSSSGEGETTAEILLSIP